MPGLEYLIPFLAATAAFAYLPGPAMLYTAAQTIARGRAAGFWAAFGIHLGCYVHVAAAAFGLSAVFELVPVAYVALKLAGAAYLVYLGVGLIVQRRRLTGAAAPSRTRRNALVQSVLVEVLNPKVAIFFIAFLPQFVDPSAALPLWAQFLILGTMVNIAFSSADIVVVVFASTVMARARRSGMLERLARKLAGTLLVGLGARLALDRGT